MTDEINKILEEAKDVLIEHVEAAEGEVLKLVHFAGEKFHVAEQAIVALVKREAHDTIAAGDAVVEYGEEHFAIAEDAILACLRLHGRKVEDPKSADGNADASKASV